MTARPDQRPAMREPPRDYDARAAEILAHLDGNLDEGPDRFYVDNADVPEGASYEWKRWTTLGKEDPSYQVALARMGWEPVPASRHPAYMPSGYRGKVIEREGMVLMERPKAITDKVRQIERRKATDQVRQKEEQLNSAPSGQFERQKSDGSSLVKVKTTYEAPMAVPD